MTIVSSADGKRKRPSSRVRSSRLRVDLWSEQIEEEISLAYAATTSVEGH